MASRRSRTTTDDAPAAKLDKATLRKTLRIFRYLRPHCPIFAFGLVCLLITSLLSLAFPLLLGKLVNAEPLTSFWEAPISDLNNIDSIAKLLLLVFALQAFFGYLRIYTFGPVSYTHLTLPTSDLV